MTGLGAGETCSLGLLLEGDGRVTDHFRKPGNCVPGLRSEGGALDLPYLLEVGIERDQRDLLRSNPETLGVGVLPPGTALLGGQVTE